MFPLLLLTALACGGLDPEPPRRAAAPPPPPPPPVPPRRPAPAEPVCDCAGNCSDGAGGTLPHEADCATQRPAPEFDGWVRRTLPWGDYPAGTRARAVMGGTWLKLDDGRWKAEQGGDTFPAPAGDALDVRLPARTRQPPRPAAPDVWGPKGRPTSLNDPRLNLGKANRPPPGTDRVAYVELLLQGFTREESLEVLALRAMPLPAMREFSARALAGDESIPAERRAVIASLAQKLA